jgi:hypothetical protein
MNPESESQNQESKPRKSYSAPSLIIYGAVRSLTQSGAGSMAETGPYMIGSTTFCSFQTNRRPCSERRVKENIVRIGDHPLGFGLYLFDYRPEHRAQWGRGRQFGVMIDEVERVVPEAVSMHPDGYKRVDHSLLGIYQHRH